MNAATVLSSIATDCPIVSALDRACQAARLAADHKAREILVLDMRGQTPLFDYFVLITGATRRQIHVLAEELDASMRGLGDQRLSIEGFEASKWCVQDYGDVVIHLFSPETREYYRLEELWQDAPRIDWMRN